MKRVPMLLECIATLYQNTRRDVQQYHIECEYDEGLCAGKRDVADAIERLVYDHSQPLTIDQIKEWMGFSREECINNNKFCVPMGNGEVELVGETVRVMHKRMASGECINILLSLSVFHNLEHFVTIVQTLTES